MTLVDLIVLILGLGLIAFIYWFFFGKKDEAVKVDDEVKITVQGGYKPDVIKVDKNKSVKLLITRTDENSCLEEIVFPDYKIKHFLPLNQEVTITLKPPHKTGDFHCGMSMYFGKIITD